MLLTDSNDAHGAEWKTRGRGEAGLAAARAEIELLKLVHALNAISGVDAIGECIFRD